MKPNAYVLILDDCRDYVLVRPLGASDDSAEAQRFCGVNGSQVRFKRQATVAVAPFRFAVAYATVEIRFVSDDSEELRGFRIVVTALRYPVDGTSCEFDYQCRADGAALSCVSDTCRCDDGTTTCASLPTGWVGRIFIVNVDKILL